jgi:hypothetical protein
MKKVLNLAAVVALALAPISVAQAATLASGTYGPGDFVDVAGSVGLGPGKYRFDLNLGGPVDDFFGEVPKTVVTNYFCDFGDGSGVVGCGGDDVQELNDLLAITPTHNQTFITVNPFISVPLAGGDAVRYDEFDICCDYHFSFTVPGGVAARFAALDAAGYVFSYNALPEPSTWGLMILGFGAIGASLRRRLRTTLVHA